MDGKSSHEAVDEVDPQKLLKACPVKMKSITSFFKPPTTKLIKDVKSKDIVEPLEMDETNKEKSSKVSVIYIDNDIEMSYEDFVKETKEKGVNIEESKQETTEVSYQTFLVNCTEKENTSSLINKTEDKNKAGQQLNDDQNDHNINELTGPKQSPKNESQSEDTVSMILVKEEKFDTAVNEVSEMKEEQKFDTAVNEVSEMKEEQIKPVTGKGSILNFFQKTEKKDADKKPAEPDVVITKVEALIHSEPTPVVKETSHISEKTFSIFDLSKRKSGLEVNSNVSISSTDIDMCITVIETVVTESNNNVDASIEDTECQETVEKAKSAQEKKKAAESKISSLDKIKVSSKGNHSQSKLNFGKKAAPSEKAKRKRATKKSNSEDEERKTPNKKHKKSKKSLDSSQTDEFTPNSKKGMDSNHVRKRVVKFCGNCPACNIKEDCGECIFCLDKPKFGGPGTKKQKCKVRKCENFDKHGHVNKENTFEMKKGKKVVKAKQLLQKAKARKSLTNSQKLPLGGCPKKTNAKKSLLPTKPEVDQPPRKSKKGALTKKTELENNVVASTPKRNQGSSSSVSTTPSSTVPSKRGKRSLSDESFGSSGSEGALRRSACGQCASCQREDCGKCSHCKDKPKFGGLGKMKQKCKFRRCNKLMTPNKNTQKSSWAKQLLERAKTPRGKEVKSKSPTKVQSSRRKRRHNQDESESDGEAKTPSKNKKKSTTSKTPTNEVEQVESGRRRTSRQSAQAANKALSQVTLDEEFESEASSMEATPKRTRKKKAETPSKTPRRKGTKLAPIFKKSGNKKETSDDSDVEIIMTEEDKERLKIRRAFLMSGVPEEVRKQQQTNVAIQLTDFPLFPQISHVQQVEEDEPIWSILPPDLQFKEVCGEVLLPTSDAKLNLCGKSDSKSDCTKLSDFKEHKNIKEEIVKLLLAEINTSNSLYPVKRTYRQLLTKRKEAEKLDKDPDTECNGVKESDTVNKVNKKRKLEYEIAQDIPPRQKRKRRKDSESVIVVDESDEDENNDDRRRSTGKKLSLRRSSRSKSKLEESVVGKSDEETTCKGKNESNIADMENTEMPPNICCKRELLWTEKYAPSSSKEIIGNSRNVEKLKIWLQDWKKLTDLEMKRLQKQMEKQEKKNKKKAMQKEQLQKKEKKASEWSDESDFEDDFDDDDSGSDYIPESDFETGLCNTMLVTGPHGIGKTATVYALAQELGYKVFEVNASSKRGGKQVLAQLQEATQSHQVSNKSLEDVFSTILSGASVKPKTEQKEIPKKSEKKALPTAFTNLINRGRACGINSQKNSPVKGRGRKCSAENKSGDADVQEKKRPGRRSKRKSSDDVIFMKEEKTPVKTKNSTKGSIDSKKDRAKGLWGNLLNKKPDTETNDSDSNTKKGLDLSSCSLILFEEVDLIFEEDKGFWAAIQTFMNTTKRPIVLTTTDPNFTKKFDPKCELRIENLHMRTPPMVNIATYLQLVCLAENIRSHFRDLFSLAKMFSGNIRQLLFIVQMWVESGGSCQPMKEPLSYNKYLLNKKAAATEDEDIGSQSSQTPMVQQSSGSQRHFCIDENAQLPDAIKPSADTDDDFELSRPRRRNLKSRAIIEDDSSMDSIMGTPVKIFNPVMMSSLGQITEEDSQHSQALSVDSALVASQSEKNENTDLCVNAWTEDYPLMHMDCFATLLGLNCNAKDCVLGSEKSTFSSHESEKSVKIFFDTNIDILSLNFEQLLPLPRKIVPLHLYTKFQNIEHITKHLKRIKNTDDLFDSEGDSSDQESTLKLTEQTSTDKQNEHSSKKTMHNKHAAHLVTSSLDALSKLYDEFSFSDSYLRKSNSDNYSLVQEQKFKLNSWTNSLSPGQLDTSPVPIEDENDWLKFEYVNEIRSVVQFGKYIQTKQKLKEVMQKVTELDEEVGSDVIDYLTIPVESLKKCIKCTELSPVQLSLQNSYRSAAKNVYAELNPKSKREQKYESSCPMTCTNPTSAVVLDYIPIIRNICKVEKLKEESKTKRRFLHYLESQHITLKKSTIDTLCITFT